MNQFQQSKIASPGLSERFWGGPEGWSASRSRRCFPPDCRSSAVSYRGKKHKNKVEYQLHQRVTKSLLPIITCGGFCFSADTVPFVLPFRSFSADIVPFLYRSVHFKPVPLPVFEGTVHERYNTAPIPVLLIKGTVIERYRNSINTVPVLFITVRLPVL